ncbi:MAG TPA: helix-turn-helix transcriptional regulator [Bacteroidales bacterium]|jgi:transcriptional regulator with XRE-family HTH domain|nr:helix-turn-helix transcriptional regulator [Bacteroidales bacterium]
MRDRIIEFLRIENKSAAQLAEEIGVQPSGISHIISGRNRPSLDFVLKMLEKYSFLSTEWLLFGRGNMYNDGQSIKEVFETDTERENLKQDENDPIQIELTANKSVEIQELSPGKKEKTVLTRIVLFYDDKSFQEYFPAN